MKPFRALTIFCEYLRTDASGVDTLVGVFPGSLNIPKPSPDIELVGVPIHTYSKIEFLCSDGVPQNCALTLRYDGKDLFNNIVDSSLLLKEFDSAKEQGLEKAIIISRTQGQGLVLPAISGNLQSFLNLDGEETLVGEIKMNFLDS